MQKSFRQMSDRDTRHKPRPKTSYLLRKSQGNRLTMSTSHKVASLAQPVKTLPTFCMVPAIQVIQSRVMPISTITKQAILKRNRVISRRQLCASPTTTLWKRGKHHVTGARMQAESEIQATVLSAVNFKQIQAYSAEVRQVY